MFDDYINELQSHDSKAQITKTYIHMYLLVVPINVHMYYTARPIQFCCCSVYMRDLKILTQLPHSLRDGKLLI